MKIIFGIKILSSIGVKGTDARIVGTKICNYSMQKPTAHKII